MMLQYTTLNNVFQRKFNKNRLYCWGDTLIVQAVREGMPAMVELLIKNGLRIGILSKRDGESVASYATRKGI